MVTLQLGANSAECTEEIGLHIENSLKIPIDVTFKMTEIDGENVIFIGVRERNG